MGVRQAEVLFLDFIKWGFDERGWARETRRNYRLRVRAADEWIRANSNKSLFSANDRTLRLYLFSTAPNARNRNHIRQALVAFYAFLNARGFRDDNPAQLLPRLPTNKPLPQVLDSEQACTVLRAARVLGPRAEAIVAVLLYTGMRRNEARRLKWACVEEEWIRFEATKTRRERQIPLHPSAALALRKWRLHCRGAAYVFAGRDPNKPMSNHTLNKIVQNVGELAGIHLYPRICRHTCATTLLEHDVDLRTIQEWLGHASPTSTVVYTHVRNPRLMAARDKLDYT